MKEVTKWDGKTREMWVWDYEEFKKKLLVLYIFPNTDRKSRVVVVSGDVVMEYMHCAEIEECSESCMTFKELFLWLTANPLRQILYPLTGSVSNNVSYLLRDEDEQVPNSWMIRENPSSEWKKPLAKLLKKDE